jgi:hypothetical protein
MENEEPVRRHHMLNREWWTPARKVKGIIVAIGGLSFAISCTVGAMDMINERCIQPDFSRRFEKCYRPYRIADSIRNMNFQDRTTMRLMKIDNGLEVTMAPETRAVRDAAFKHDSLLYVQAQRGNNP